MLEREVAYKKRNRAYQIDVSPDGALWLAGEGGLMTSIDKGLTWLQPQLPPEFLDEKWHAIDLSTSGIDVVAGNGSCLGVTLDSGNTWSKHCSDKIRFGLMFDIGIQGNTAVIASSSNTASDSISRATLPWAMH